MTNYKNQSVGTKIDEVLQARKQYNYHLFLKYFDEVCIVDENNKWVGVIGNSETNNIYSLNYSETKKKNNLFF